MIFGWPQTEVPVRPAVNLIEAEFKELPLSYPTLLTGDLLMLSVRKSRSFLAVLGNKGDASISLMSALYLCPTVKYI